MLLDTLQDNDTTTTLKRLITRNTTLALLEGKLGHYIPSKQAEKCERCVFHQIQCLPLQGRHSMFLHAILAMNADFKDLLSRIKTLHQVPDLQDKTHRWIQKIVSCRRPITSILV